MFCSNQIFSVCGDKKDYKALEKTVGLFSNGFEFFPECYKILEDGRLCFFSYIPYDKEGIIEICKEDRVSDFYIQIINLYFCSYRYKYTLYNNVVNEYKNGDGSTSEGWKISYNEDGFLESVIVEPFWCFYHK